MIIIIEIRDNLTIIIGYDCIAKLIQHLLSWARMENSRSLKDHHNICLFLFQPLPSRVQPQKGCLCLPQVTAPVKSSSQTACCVHISLPAPSFSRYPHHTLSHGDGCSPITQYKITAQFFLSSLFPDHIFVNSSFLKLSSNCIIQICYFTANPDW